METVSYFAIEASSDLAKERGSYSSYEGSLWSQGIFPIDSISILKEHRTEGFLDQNEEKKKDWDTLKEKVKKQGIRNSNVMAIGFAASLFKRGLKFINVPTTLLSQVDSSIGGKTGVNTKYGKNLVGSFYQPNLVISDTEFLKTLPNREIVCGYGEILKHSIIGNKKFYTPISSQFWSENPGRLLVLLLVFS